MGAFVVVLMFGLLGLTAALPTTTSAGCVCTDEYDPVCGKNGETYSNECQLNCTGVELDYHMACRHICACPRIYMPVCGVDGITYSNMCTLKCEGVELLKQGVCDGENAADEIEPCICTLQYDPVCGVDDITYGNECALNCAGVTKAKDGSCEERPTLTPP